MYKRISDPIVSVFILSDGKLDKFFGTFRIDSTNIGGSFEEIAADILSNNMDVNSLVMVEGTCTDLFLQGRVDRISATVISRREGIEDMSPEVRNIIGDYRRETLYIDEDDILRNRAWWKRMIGIG